MKNYYRIILGRKHENFDEAKKGNFVGVGFLSDIDLSNELTDFIDSGKGIEEKIMTQIFNPLFTTKQKGTGLGLVTCKNIIEQHGGTISVKNNPTTFTIQLPKV